MDWHLKAFDPLNDDAPDAHIDSSKGRTLLRTVATDSVTREVLAPGQALERGGNCLYDLFAVHETGGTDQTWWWG